MLKNVCTADQKDHRKFPFLHEGNDGGETEPRPFEKIKIAAFHSHLFSHFEVCLFSKGNLQR